MIQKKKIKDLIIFIIENDRLKLYHYKWRLKMQISENDIYAQPKPPKQEKSGSLSQFNCHQCQCQWPLWQAAPHCSPHLLPSDPTLNSHHSLQRFTLRTPKIPPLSSSVLLQRPFLRRRRSSKCCKP